MRFMDLVSIENKKLWKRLSSKIMFLLVILLIIGVPCMMKVYESTQPKQKAPTQEANWKNSVKQDLTQQEQSLAQAEKSSSKTMRMSIGSLKKTVAEDKYQLEHNIAPASSESIWDTMIMLNNDVGYGSIIALMLIIACTTLVAGEFSEGTMKMMISRPYSRREILSAKLLVSILYGLTLLVSTIVLSFVMSGLLFGFNGLSSKSMLWTGSKIIYMPGIAKILCIFGIDFLTVIFYTIFAFALSTLTRSRSISTGFSVFMLIAGSSLVQLVGVFFSFGKYLPFAVTDFNSTIAYGAKLEGVTLSFSLIMSAIYLVILVVAGYMAFEKRDI